MINCSVCDDIRSFIYLCRCKEMFVCAVILYNIEFVESLTTRLIENPFAMWIP